MDILERTADTGRVGLAGRPAGWHERDRLTSRVAEASLSVYDALLELE